MTKRKIDWILVLIFLMAFLVRLKFYFDGIEWNNIDNVRDILIAKHINLYGEYPQRGPSAAGGFGVLLNSSFYYYFWTLAWKIFPSEKVFPIVMMLLGIGTLYLCNLLAKLIIKDKWYRYLFLVWIALSPVLIKSSVDPSQPTLTMFWTLLVLWGIVKFYKSGKEKYWWWVIIGNWLALETHYSIFVVYPLIIIWGLISIRKWKMKIGKLLLAIAVTIFIWIMTTYRNVPGDQIGYLKIFFEKSSFGAKELVEGIRYLTNNLLMDMGWIVLVPTLWLVKMFKKNEVYFWTGLGALFLGLVLIASQLKVTYSAVEYLKIYLILCPLLGVYLMDRFLQKKYFVLVFLGLLLITKLIYFKNSGFWEVAEKSNLAIKQIAELIYKDAGQNFKDKKYSFRIWGSDNGGEMYDFCSVTIWYWLEKMTNSHLVSLDIKDGNTFYPIGGKNLNYGYLVCTNIGNFFDISNCQEKFTKNTGIESTKMNLLGNEGGRWYVYRVGI